MKTKEKEIAEVKERCKKKVAEVIPLLKDPKTHPEAVEFLAAKSEKAKKKTESLRGSFGNPNGQKKEDLK